MFQRTAGVWPLSFSRLRCITWNTKGTERANSIFWRELLDNINIIFLQLPDYGNAGGLAICIHRDLLPEEAVVPCGYLLRPWSHTLVVNVHFGPDRTLRQLRDSLRLFHPHWRCVFIALKLCSLNVWILPSRWTKFSLLPRGNRLDQDRIILPPCSWFPPLSQGGGARHCTRMHWTPHGVPCLTWHYCHPCSTEFLNFSTWDAHAFIFVWKLMMCPYTMEHNHDHQLERLRPNQTRCWRRCRTPGASSWSSSGLLCPVCRAGRQGREEFNQVQEERAKVAAELLEGWRDWKCCVPKQPFQVHSHHHLLRVRKRPSSRGDPWIPSWVGHVEVQYISGRRIFRWPFGTGRQRLSEVVVLTISADQFALCPRVEEVCAVWCEGVHNVPFRKMWNLMSRMEPVAYRVGSVGIRPHSKWFLEFGHREFQRHQRRNVSCRNSRGRSTRGFQTSGFLPQSRSIDNIGCHPSPRCIPQEGHGDESSSQNFESILCRCEVGDEWGQSGAPRIQCVEASARMEAPFVNSTVSFAQTTEGCFIPERSNARGLKNSRWRWFVWTSDWCCMILRGITRWESQTTATKVPCLVPREVLEHRPEEPALDRDWFWVLCEQWEGCRGSPSGMTAEHLRVLLRNERDSDLLCEMALDVVRADIPDEVLEAIRTGRMIVLQKPGEGVRGIVDPLSEDNQVPRSCQSWSTQNTPFNLDDFAHRKIQLQQCGERIEKLAQQDRLSKFCIDAGFPNVVEIGQYFMTKGTAEFSQFTRCSGVFLVHFAKRRRYIWTEGLYPREHQNWTRIGSYNLMLARWIWSWDQNCVCEQRQLSLVGQNFSWLQQVVHEFEQ